MSPSLRDCGVRAPKPARSPCGTTAPSSPNTLCCSTVQSSPGPDEQALSGKQPPGSAGTFALPEVVPETAGRPKTAPGSCFPVIGSQNEMLVPFPAEAKMPMNQSWSAHQPCINQAGPPGNSRTTAIIAPGDYDNEHKEINKTASELDWECKCKISYGQNGGGQKLQNCICELNKPRSLWRPNLWIEAKREIRATGGTRFSSDLFRLAARSTARTLKDGWYQVPVDFDEDLDDEDELPFGDGIKTVHLRGYQTAWRSSYWFGRINVGLVLPDSDNSVIPPPLLFSEQCPLDVAVKIRAATPKSRPLFLLLEFCDFDKNGKPDLKRHHSTNPWNLTIRTDFENFIDSANQQVRHGKSSVEQHLRAALDPYIFVSKDVCVFRSKAEDGFEFMQKPQNINIIAVANTHKRPPIQIMSTRSGPSTWYAAKADHTSLVERLNLVGLAALQATVADNPCFSDCETGQSINVDSDNLPILVMPGLGFCGNQSHPRDAFSSALKQWRRRFAALFHSVFVCCPPPCQDNFIPHLDAQVNKNINRIPQYHGTLALRMSNWHWDLDHIKLCVEGDRMRRIAQIFNTLKHSPPAGQPCNRAGHRLAVLPPNESRSEKQTGVLYRKSLKDAVSVAAIVMQEADEPSVMVGDHDENDCFTNARLAVKDGMRTARQKRNKARLKADIHDDPELSRSTEYVPTDLEDTSSDSEGGEGFVVHTTSQDNSQANTVFQEFACKETEDLNIFNMGPNKMNGRHSLSYQTQATLKAELKRRVSINQTKRPSMSSTSSLSPKNNSRTFFGFAALPEHEPTDQERCKAKTPEEVGNVKDQTKDKNPDKLSLAAPDAIPHRRHSAGHSDITQRRVAATDKGLIVNESADNGSRSQLGSFKGSHDGVDLDTQLEIRRRARENLRRHSIGEQKGQPTCLESNQNKRKSPVDPLSLPVPPAQQAPRRTNPRGSVLLVAPTALSPTQVGTRRGSTIAFDAQVAEQVNTVRENHADSDSDDNTVATGDRLSQIQGQVDVRNKMLLDVSSFAQSVDNVLQIRRSSLMHIGTSAFPKKTFGTFF